MSKTMTFTGELNILTCWCGMKHAVPSGLREHQLATFHSGGKPVSIFCPLGHSHIPAGERRADVLERQLVAERARLDQEKAESAYQRDLAQSEKRRAAAARGQVTKIKSRTSFGLCPCCNEEFPDLRTHIEAHHPDYTRDEEREASQA